MKELESMNKAIEIHLCLMPGASDCIEVLQEDPQYASTQEANKFTIVH